MTAPIPYRQVVKCLECYELVRSRSTEEQVSCKCQNISVCGTSVASRDGEGTYKAYSEAEWLHYVERAKRAHMNLDSIVNNSGASESIFENLSPYAALSLAHSTQTTPSEREKLRLQYRDKAKKNFWFFLRFCCGFEKVESQLHRQLASVYQQRVRDKYRLWMLPRGHLKTSCITTGGTLWSHVNDDIKTLIASAKSDLSRQILLGMMNIVETNDIFRWLFPEYLPEACPKQLKRTFRWGSERLDFACSRWAGTREGNIQYFSSYKGKTGFHAHRIVIDDAVDEDAITNQEMRDKHEHWLRTCYPLRENPNESIIEVVGTPWHFDDTHMRLVKAEEGRRKAQQENNEAVTPTWKLFRLPCWQERDGILNPIWPEEYSLEALQGIRSQIGSYYFSSQYLLNPLSEEDAVFFANQIHPISEWSIPTNVVNFMAIDLADSETTKGDFTVITVASFDEHGRMYVREIRHGKFSIGQLLEDIWRLCQRWTPVRVGVETTGFQKTILRGYQHAAAQSKWNIPWAEMKRGTTAKPKRIRGLQPRVERGDFFYQEGIANHDRMIDEMVHFPSWAHDDILDTLADLEALYYRAPTIISEPKAPPGSIDALFGKLEDTEQYWLECPDDSYATRPLR